MTAEQQEYLDKLGRLLQEHTQVMTEYWRQYSHAGTWQFWVNVAMLVVPLVVLYFTLDRRKVFLICFYGFSFHTLVAYVDSYMNRAGLWNYPYMIFPYMPSNLSIDAS